jgi:hypothetical protein
VPTFTVRRLFAATLAVASAFTVFTLIPTAAASADPNGNDWARIRMCESSGNYRIVDGTGTHFGAYQFDQGTWNSVRGAGRPDLASPAEQDYRALYLYRLRGWQPWQCADASHLNLRNDVDGARGRIPTYAQSAYMGGGGPVGPPVSTPPPAQVPPPPPSLPPFPPINFVIPPRGSGALVEPEIPILTIPSGACSPVLTLWQQQMNSFGYHLATTGCNSSATQAAAHDLQYANGIRQTNSIGPLTLVASFLGRKPR